ncbi:MAG: valine--tRNA ligase [Candidatus Omnitrophota bacterium]
MDLPTRYNPKETEDKWYKVWEERRYFRSSVNPDKKPFCIVIPPPNVTGILHMGHALNNTVQDILMRYHKMKGEESLWMPGTDHAGIATQNVVEKAISREGLKRQDLGREKFLERVWQWKEQYGSTIIHQLKKLGASCDWSRTRFTMDEEYSRAVREVFVILWNEGLIYQDDKVINWCPRCQTALADEEAPHQELQGSLYYLKYHFKDNSKSFVVVATTRPETMLGDTAVAVNPGDRRYKKLVGKILILPLINREIKIIADKMVDMKFGTGAVKVTPAHDPNDEILGKKHNLAFVNIMHSDGRLNENAGDYKDMDRFEAREVVLRDLKKRGLLEKVESHKLSAGHCYRCNTIVEPYLSRQWFVKMKPLAKPAIEAVKKGKIKFHPKRWTKVYLNWMENIQDWCISRQIWWGHRIPLWYCLDCKKEAFASVDTPASCRNCKSTNLKQDEDVLDTWFSSWLWPFATFYWPFTSHKSQVTGHRLEEKNLRPETCDMRQTELNYFYPTSVLVTAPEILFFWVARMVMAGLKFMKDIPFRDVYIHGTVRDVRGKKMSKSLGNAIDPLEIISEFGTDALRFCLASCAGQGDLFLSKEKFEMGRNFANKIWNASRLVLMTLNRDKAKADLCVFFQKGNLNLFDRWILSRFYSTLKAVNRNLSGYRFNEAANLLYAFFWHEFCDWYLEIAKNHLEEESCRLVTYKVLEKTLRTLHPFMPFITEEIWQKLPHEGDSITIQPWPHVQEQIIDRKSESQMESLIEIIKSIRNLRSSINLKVGQAVPVSVYPYKSNFRRLIEENRGLIANLARLEALDVLEKSGRPKDTISDVTRSADIYLHFRGLVDIDSERNRIKTNLQRQEQILRAKKENIGRKDFLSRAPAEVVNREKESIAEIENAIKCLRRMSDELR